MALFARHRLLSSLLGGCCASRRAQGHGPRRHPPPGPSPQRASPPHPWHFLPLSRSQGSQARPLLRFLLCVQWLEAAVGRGLCFPPTCPSEVPKEHERSCRNDHGNGRVRFSQENPAGVVLGVRVMVGVGPGTESGSSCGSEHRLGSRFPHHWHPPEAEWGAHGPSCSRSV